MFACLMQGMELEREKDNYTATFSYIGECSCPVLQQGRVQYHIVTGKTNREAMLAAHFVGTHLGQPVPSYPAPRQPATRQALFGSDQAMSVLHCARECSGASVLGVEGLHGLGRDAGGWQLTMDISEEVGTASLVVAEVFLGTLECLFSFNVARGSFLGLPKATGVSKTSASAVLLCPQPPAEWCLPREPNAATLALKRCTYSTVVPWGVNRGITRAGREQEMDWAGFEPDLSAPNFLQGLEEAILALAGGVNRRAQCSEGRCGGRRLLQGSEETEAMMATECPVDPDNCIYACLAQGFAAEVRRALPARPLRRARALTGSEAGQSFAGITRLVSNYEGADCNCHAVFGSPEPADGGPPSMLCTVLFAPDPPKTSP